jgi:hypothetical protein
VSCKDLVDGLMSHSLPVFDEQRLVIRHILLLARQLQVSLVLAVHVGFQNFSGDLRGHDASHVI